MTSSVLKQHIRIGTGLVNVRRILRASSLFRLLQEASFTQLEQSGFGYREMSDRGLLWILSHQSMRIREMPSYGDDILLHVRPGVMRHVFFPKYYELWKEDTCIAEGEALWMLMDEATRSAVFPSEYGIAIPGSPGVAVSSIAGTLRMPPDARVFSESLYRARFSQTDCNGHINNADYFDLIDDLLPEPVLLASSPKEIRAEYLAEIRPGSEVLLRGYEAPDNTFYIEGILPDRAEDQGPGVPAAAKRPLFRVFLSF